MSEFEVLDQGEFRQEPEPAPVAPEPLPAGLVDHHVGLGQVTDERRLGLEPSSADAALGRHWGVVVLGLHVGLQLVLEEEGSSAEVAKKVAPLLVHVGNVMTQRTLATELGTASTAVEQLGLLPVVKLLVSCNFVLGAVALSAEVTTGGSEFKSDHIPRHSGA